MATLDRSFGASPACSVLGMLILWICLGASWLAAVLLLGQFLGSYVLLALIVGLSVFAAFSCKKRIREFSVLTVLTVLMTMGFYFFLEPSNERQWELGMERLPLVVFQKDRIEIRDIRDFFWSDATTAEARWKDASYDLGSLNLLEVLVEPFGESDLLAHVFLSFGFSDGRRLVVSIEARKEFGENYGLLAGAARQFELMYVFATEKDVINLRAQHRGSRVYAYPIDVDDEFKRLLLSDICQSANSLHENPRFYATIRDNCTTTLFKHTNRLSTEKVGWRLGALFPAKLGSLLYELGLIDAESPFEDVQESFRIQGARD